MSHIGRVHFINQLDTQNGPGIRTTVQLQGCPLQCSYCIAPAIRSEQEGMERTVSSLFRDVLQYQTLMGAGGITLSGGEPLQQPDFCSSLLSLCRENGIHTAIKTTGCIPLSRCKDAVDQTDLILLEFKSADSAQAALLTGEGNENTLALLSYCQSQKKAVWIRYTLIAGVTTDPVRLEKDASFLQAYSCIEKVEFFTYHRPRLSPWEEQKLQAVPKEAPPVSSAQLREAREIFSRHQLVV